VEKEKSQLRQNLARLQEEKRDAKDELYRVQTQNEVLQAEKLQLETEADDARARASCLLSFSAKLCNEKTNSS
jgi:hypothetical protein